MICIVYTPMYSTGKIGHRLDNFLRKDDIYLNCLSMAVTYPSNSPPPESTSLKSSTLVHTGFTMA